MGEFADDALERGLDDYFEAPADEYAEEGDTQAARDMQYDLFIRGDDSACRTAEGELRRALMHRDSQAQEALDRELAGPADPPNPRAKAAQRRQRLAELEAKAARANTEEKKPLAEGWCQEGMPEWLDDK